LTEVEALLGQELLDEMSQLSAGYRRKQVKEFVVAKFKDM
jgi:hypothetical protein